MMNDRRSRFLGVFAVQRLFGIALVQPDPGGAIVAPMQPDKPGQLLLHRIVERVIGSAHIGEHCPALGRGNFARMQDGKARRHLLIG